ncbi:MAG: F0F1 ATP synthase subunit epsilon [Ardenticatenaceae bacterium]
MAKLALDIVTIERKVWEDDGVDMVILPGTEGELGILPKHTPLLTALNPGVILIRKGDVEELFAVSGGFADVRPDKVIVLAQSAEHSEEIDAQRAEEARERAAEALENPPEAGPSLAIMRQALMRSQVRLKVARRRRQGMGRPPLGSSDH